MARFARFGTSYGHRSWAGVSAKKPRISIQSSSGVIFGMARPKHTASPAAYQDSNLFSSESNWSGVRGGISMTARFSSTWAGALWPTSGASTPRCRAQKLQGPDTGGTLAELGQHPGLQKPPLHEWHAGEDADTHGTGGLPKTAPYRPAGSGWAGAGPDRGTC